MRFGAGLRRQVANETGLVRRAFQRCIMNDDQFACIGQMDVEFDRIDAERQHVAKTGQRIFRPQIAGAAMAEAIRYGMSDLERLERMVLRRIARDFFVLPCDADTDPETVRADTWPMSVGFADMVGFTRTNWWANWSSC